jgi:uncharacterized protein (DUF2235 family)
MNEKPQHRNLILCSDGTGNSAGKGRGTNVWRIYEALARPSESKDDWPLQLSIHDDGVGTSGIKFLALLGGAFGLGLARNVRELYTWLARNYREGDKIFLFGFSRGAFTVRCLAGMICRLGIPIRPKEEEMDATVREAWSTFKWCQSGSETAEEEAKKIRDSSHRPNIHFIGVWDTVDAYGLPFDGLRVLVVKATQIFNRFRLTRWLAWTKWGDNKLHEDVLKACHALAIDDERVTFHPVLWDEKGSEGPRPGNPDPRIEQVWFPGMHSDVGGGYPRGSLARVTLDWMMAKAYDEGLRFDPKSVDAVRSEMNWLGPMHDSRRLAGTFYRYGPREVEGDRRFLKALRIHASVPERIHHMGGDQAPQVLPADFEVVHTQWQDTSVGAGERPEVDYHQARPHPTVLSHLARLHKLRRWLYGAFIVWAISAVAVFFFGLSERAGIPAEAGWGWFGGVIRWLRDFLPEAADRIIHVLLNEPWWTVFFLFIGLLLLALHLAAKKKCLDLARRAWQLPPLDSPEATAKADAVVREVGDLPTLFKRWPVWAPLGAAALWTILGIGLWFSVERGFSRPDGGGAMASLTAPTPSDGLHANIANSVVFRTDDPSLATGIHLRAGERYRVRVEMMDPWRDNTLDASPVGLKEDASRIMGLMEGFRRDPGADWFVLLGSVGSPDRDPFPLVTQEQPPDTWGGRIGPMERSGELFVFVNDAVSYLTPGGAWTFYGNNHGRARISIELITR